MEGAAAAMLPPSAVQPDMMREQGGPSAGRGTGTGPRVQLDDAEMELALRVRRELTERIRDRVAANPDGGGEARWCAGGRAVLWGVCLASVREEDYRDHRDGRVLLYKFLQSRAGSVPGACDMIVESLEWRASFGADALIGDDERAPDRAYRGLIEAKHFMVIDADADHLDKMGRPIVVHRYGAFADEDTWRLAFDYDSPGAAGGVGPGRDAGGDAVADVNDTSDAMTVNDGGEVCGPKRAPHRFPNGRAGARDRASDPSRHALCPAPRAELHPVAPAGHGGERARDGPRVPGAQLGQLRPRPPRPAVQHGHEQEGALDGRAADNPPERQLS